MNVFMIGNELLRKVDVEVQNFQYKKQLKMGG